MMQVLILTAQPDSVQVIEARTMPPGMVAVWANGQVVYVPEDTPPVVKAIEEVREQATQLVKLDK